MDEELARLARLIDDLDTRLEDLKAAAGLQQLIIKLQQQLLAVQDDLAVSRQQCLSFFFMIDDIRTPNHEFIGTIDKIQTRNNDKVFIITDGDKHNRYVMDIRRFRKRSIIEGMEVHVTGNIADLVSLKTPHRPDGFIYAIPVATIFEVTNGNEK